MKTSELTGAQLDYYVARAEGIPAEQLTIRPVPRTDILICAHSFYDVAGLGGLLIKRVDYSTNWQVGGPLIEKHWIEIEHNHGWLEFSDWGDGKPSPRWTSYHPEWVNPWTGNKGKEGAGAAGEGDTPLQAICRAVVRAAFGDEVEEVAVCE